MKVFIIEHDAKSADTLARAVTKRGHEIVAVCHSAEGALTVSQRCRFNLAVIDLDLCGTEDGIRCAERLLLRCNPKIIYTVSEVDDFLLDEAMQTRPLNILTKPLGTQHILIALALAEQHMETPKYRSRDIGFLGDCYRYRSDEDEVHGPEGRIELSSRENRLLKLLLKAEGRPLDLATIASSLNEKPLKPATVRSLVRRLRGKLPGAVETVRGYGYRIAVTR